MKKYNLSIYADSSFCELCNEYHRLANCPKCGEPITDHHFTVGSIGCCPSCGTSFVTWVFPTFKNEARRNEKCRERAAIAVCEHVADGGQRCAVCEEPARERKYYADAESSDTLLCVESACPILRGITA